MREVFGQARANHIEEISQRDSTQTRGDAEIAEPCRSLALMQF